MSRKFWALPLLALLLATTSQAGTAKTYRWVDDKGRVHYSDVPVPSAEQVDVKPGSGVVGIPKPPGEGSPDQQDQNCGRLKEQLATYESATSITETDNLGRQKTYSAGEREQLLSRLRGQVAATCSSPS